ncbi:MAG: hypothetical protein E7386_03110 [Ruminococcaceae bacterium]|nr:hypothetical protein [Oscillospiraceae bacterium]
MFENEGKWFKGNLHMHTTDSDGRLDPVSAREEYRKRGFDFIAVTDHWRLSGNVPSRDGGMLELSGVEYDTGDMINTKIFHILGIGMDRPAFDKVDHNIPPQEIIKAINAAGGIAILAHPAWSIMNPEDIEKCEGIAGAEIFNTVSSMQFGNGRRSDASHYFDIWADNGHLIRPFASDDSHMYKGEQTQNFIMVKAPELTRDAIITAIRKGDFYASQGPEFKAIRRAGDTIAVECRGASKILFLSNCVWDSQRVQDCTNGFARYTFSSVDKYVRVELVSEDGKMAWSAPIAK